MRHSKTPLLVLCLLLLVSVVSCTRASDTPTPPAPIVSSPSTPTPIPSLTSTTTPALPPTTKPTLAAPTTTKPVPSYFIDANCHIQPTVSSGSLYGVDLLVSGMDKAGIAKTVLVNRRFKSETKAVVEAYRKYPDRIIPFRGDDDLDVNIPASLDPFRADLDTGFFHGVGEVATRHGDDWVDIPPDHPLMLDLFRLNAEYGIPVLVHCFVGSTGEWLAEFERALTQCPKTTFIWAHTGPSSTLTLKRMFDEYPNLYTELSSLNPVWTDILGEERVNQYVESPEWIRLLEAYPDRFLFGTDADFAGTYVGLPDIVAWFRDNVTSQLSPATAEAIAHGNAERLFGITPSAGADKRPSVIVPSPGPERRMVSVTLGPINGINGIRQVPMEYDGRTKETSLGGRPCRLMVSNGKTMRFMYFDVQNDFIYAQNTKVAATVEYFDTGTGWFVIQYDSSDSTQPEERRSFKGTAQVRLRNSDTWQTATFEITDAYFGDRQYNGASDFRIAGPDQDLAISRVTVSR